jgi:hypothetical protein
MLIAIITRLETGKRTLGGLEMKFRLMLFCAIGLILIPAGGAFAADPKLDGAYKYVSTVFPGGQQTEAEVKGLLVVHGKHMAFVRANVDRKTWDQAEPAEDRNKKIIAAYNGLAATCGTFEVKGNVITLHQIAQASPLTMGKSTQWEYKLEGKMLKLKIVGQPNVEFTFEKVE